ncbi:ATP-binding protein [Nocardioides lianchengensis]|uniref:Serine/threonine-protein kinase RsbW n=1 Tax=Nocardioides lianchengensis TaxID=1045774 RepID=A0A1G6REA7_9ACTN|nr:ATP-binding protein [Nocardioides lianchengensis]NYG10266.1 serine/threonine-protein kinase RsbW [Nocardioides lianchengensis]SDD02868.1 serine/threonine-protein kinase RsbW [Nocardioides lianchengensis]
MPDPTPDGLHLDQSMPTTPDAVDLAHEQLARLWAADGDVLPADRVRFELAVIEILGNIVEHAWIADEGSPSERRLTLALTLTDERLEAVLGDNGRPASIDLSSATMPGADAESGRGLALSLAAVDSLDYERVDGRNLWRIRCDRAPA